MPRWSQAFSHPGLWRPYRRTWRIARQRVRASPAVAKPVVVILAVLPVLAIWVVLTGLLVHLWMFRMWEFLQFGRSGVNFSHRSPERHANCLACYPRGRPRA